MTIVEMDEKHVPMIKMYFKMAIPVVMGMLTNMVYNIADTWFISATANTNLIAGVSLNAPLLTFLMAFGNIFGQGGTSMISRLIGQKNTESSRKVSATCFYLAACIGLVLCAVLLIFKTPVLRLLGASDDTFEYALSYYRWIAIGAVFVVEAYVPMNLLRAEGMAKESMIDSMGGAIVNLILDPIFIFVFGLGAAGAAMATIMGYVFMNTYAIIIINKKSTVLSVSIHEAKASRSDIAAVCSVGIPAAITNILQSVSSVLVNQFLLPYGDDRIAAMGIALKVSHTGNAILTGLTFGSLSLFGYYFGGKRKDKFMELFHCVLRVVTITAVVMTVILFIPAEPIIRFFVEDASLVEMGTEMLRLQVAAFIPAGIVLLIQILFQGMGRAKEMFTLSVCRQGVIFIAVLFVASWIAGYYGVIASQAISSVFSLILAVFLYVRWKKSYIWEEP